MVKEIYIIRNYINDKVYIGQSVDSKQRWANHLSNARHKNRWSAIDFSMAKHGIENFYYEIIETTENYNERERYWIQYYNSVLPNGYNCDLGGSGLSGVESHNGLIKDQEMLESIITELIAGNKSQVMIGEQYGISKKIISAINRGTAYRQPGIQYPIRRKIQDLVESDAKKIQQDLLTGKVTCPELALKYQYSLSAIQAVNKGWVFNNSEYTYPLFKGFSCNKKFSPQEIQEIQELLMNTKILQKDIAAKYNMTATYIRDINSGRNQYNKNLSYPLRKKGN